MKDEFDKTFAASYIFAGVAWAVVLAILMAAAAHGQEGLDLPIDPPRFQIANSEQPLTTAQMSAPELEGDDPRDTPPPTLYGEELDSEGDALVYVIDLSCSMSLPDPNPYVIDGATRTGTRFDRAVAELTASINSLADNMRFSVIRYGTAFIAWKTSLQPATAENKLSAITWVAQSGCLGMTTTGPAVVYSFSLQGHEHVVLLTDGKPNWDGASVRPGPWHRELIHNRNERGAVIDVFGLHVCGLARTFCQGVASDSGGTFYEID